MCRKTLRVPAIALVLTLLVSLGAFGAGSGQKKSPDLVTLTALNMAYLSAGVQEGYYWTEILKEDLGIALEFVPSTPENVQAYLASGDIPDIAMFGSATDLETAIKAGLLVNYDDHKARLPNLFANGGAMPQYMRDNMSAGTGGFYGIRVFITNKPSKIGTNNMGPYLRWDYYKELGMPEIVEFEDYLPVLKTMVDRHPVTESGQKVYGISLWSSWDNGQKMAAAYYPMQLMGQFSPGGYLEVDLRTGASRSMLDDDSYYRRVLKFYFNANQMGILDPESITQRWETFLEKGTAGRNLFALQIYGMGNFDTPEKAAQGIGFRLVPFKNEQIYSWVAPNYVGSRGGLAVSKKTKNLEKSLAFIDYYSSYDGIWQLYNGRKGVKWDLDEKGEPYLTELGWRIKEGAEFPNGGKNNDGTALSTQEPVISYRAIHPVYKRRIDTEDWIKTDFAPKDTALVTDWKKAMNAEDYVDYFTRNKMLVEPPFAPMSVAPDDIQLLTQRVGEVVQPASWKMVYAKNEAEFNAIWAEMVSQAKGIGVDRVNKWYLDAYTAARTLGAKYMY
jgi:putative aldouronate transport system substrate-binding protein